MRAGTALGIFGRTDSTPARWTNRICGSRFGMWNATRYGRTWWRVRKGMFGRAPRRTWVATDQIGSSTGHSTRRPCGAEHWKALLAEPEELEATRALQRGTFSGRPVGSPEFVAELERKLGRPSAIRLGQQADTASKAARSQ